MNPAHALRRLARILAAALAAGLACAAAPAALATPRPQPPGWNKHPPLPAHAHTLAAGGLPGWQLPLIAVLALLLAIALAVTYRLRAARRRISATTA